MVPDDKTANFGDVVRFERGGMVLEGKVLPSSCANSVIVDLSIMEGFKDLDMEHDRTVVNHNKYKVVS
ncbi:YkvS family protein [Pontibacillus salicampi]|uniref:YkvS family protein n=1 Tax=Pontibacillus salicampi TaxID=1449801 RepID=A0ABV6LRN0_9BACI